MLSPLRQLTGLDALFLTQEATDTPMHIGLLMLYRPAKSSRGPVRFKDILDTFRQRVHSAPVFHQAVGKVPLGLDHPFWFAAQQLDIEFHVRHIVLPKPGDWRQLCIQVARLQARMLDRTRPLWEAYVIEGLDNINSLPAGSFAIFFKMHHAAVDGAIGQADAEPLQPSSGGAYAITGGYWYRQPASDPSASCNGDTDCLFRNGFETPP